MAKIHRFPLKSFVFLSASLALLAIGFVAARFLPKSQLTVNPDLLEQTILSRSWILLGGAPASREKAYQENLFRIFLTDEEFFEGPRSSILVPAATEAFQSLDLSDPLGWSEFHGQHMYRLKLNEEIDALNSAGLLLLQMKAGENWVNVDSMLVRNPSRGADPWSVYRKAASEFEEKIRSSAHVFSPGSGAR